MASRPAPELRLLSTRVYRGPNIWSYEQAVHAVVDLGVLEDHPTDRLPGFTDELLALLPGIEEHTCSIGVSGGFVQRMRQGTWLGHVTEHVALQLQQEAGHDLRRGKTRSVRGKRGRYNVIVAYLDEFVGTAAIETAVRLVNHFVDPTVSELDPEQAVLDFLHLARRQAFGPSTAAILEEAISRDIPWQRLNRGSLVQLGQGVHARRFRATMTSLTGSLAVDIACDKDLTTTLLGSAGLPVPRSEVVHDVASAVAAADRIGYPVVVKPLDGNHGRGVMLDLRTEDDVREAFPTSYEQSRRGQVLVESYITGRDYRCLIVGGRMAAVAERVPAHVVGDGTHTVRELVDLTNADPRRGVGHEKVLTRIRLDDAAAELARAQGWELDAVPPAGETVKLALTGNMSTGGISIDRTWDAHPDNVEIAEEAARVVGLDVAGIDFICPDITEPVRDTGGAICEVNAAPGFRMHTHPTIGEPQFVAKPVVDLLFPPGSPSRVPIVAVTGTNGKTTTARMISHIFKGLGRKVGMTSTDGVVIDERLVIKADASGPRSAKMVLQNPRVELAVMEVARGGILREGLGYDRNDVAVVTNIAADHLGMKGIDTLEQLARVKSVVVEAVPRHGHAVLNADDPHVREMRRRCSGSVIWFSIAPAGSEQRRMIDEHCRRGGRAVVVDETDRGEMIVIRQGRRSMQLAFTHLLPSTFGGAARMNVANAAAAAGAALALGTPLSDIRQGLRTYTTSYYLSPGRMNLLTVGGREVVVDYCHNAAGMEALGQFVERYADRKEADSTDETTGERSVVRRVGMIATAGDRRDDDMRELGRVAARYFDTIVVREDDHKRGRAAGEMAGLVVEGVEEATRAGARVTGVEAVLDEVDAVRRSLALARRGDLVVLCVDKHAKVMAELESVTQVAVARGWNDQDESPVQDADYPAREATEAAEAAESVDAAEVAHSTGAGEGLGVRVDG